MGKSLADMTLTELWELFPIVLSPHNPLWLDWARDEINVLSLLLAGFSPLINHIGSTAIPDIHAKPIVDILVEVSPDVEFSKIKHTLKESGYICMSESCERLSFNKGYTPEGYDEKVFHVHVHRIGDNDEILFRDYMIAHHDKAQEYEQLKLSLLPAYRNNRDGYTEAKSDFVKFIVNQAKESD